MLIIFPSLIQLHKPIQAEDEEYRQCKDSFIKCGNLTNLGYPFYDDEDRPEYCGYPGFKVDCSDGMPEISMSYDDSYVTSGVSMSTTQFYLLDYNNTSHTVSVAREDYWENDCPKDVLNTTINFTLFTYTSNDKNVTIYYQCSYQTMVSPYQFSCPDGMYGYFAPNAPDMTLAGTCKTSIFVPVYQTAASSMTGNTTLHAALSHGFELQWYAENDRCDECSRSGGACGYDPNLKKFTCYCADGPNESNCNGMSALLSPQFLLLLPIPLICFSSMPCNISYPFF